MIQRILAIVLALGLTAFALPALAGGRIIYRLGLQPPKEVMRADGEAQHSYSQMAADRLRKRFVAAAVKEYEFRVVTPNTLVIETGWDHDPGWLEALMTSPGRLELRRVTPNVPDWLGLARQLPADVELRGDQPPYLWAAKRSALTSVLKRLSVPNGVLTVFPEDGGFRSVSLGEIVATEKQVQSVQARQSSTGAPFVLVNFESAVGASLAAAHVSDVEQIAIVLDGELVAFALAKSFLERSPVRLSVPEGAVPNDRAQRDLWVRQVAGRLAAPLPIAIAVLKE